MYTTKKYKKKTLRFLKGNCLIKPLELKQQREEVVTVTVQELGGDVPMESKFRSLRR